MINIDGTAYYMPKDAEVAVRRVLCRLDTNRTRLAIADKQILDYEETEAKVCPEDVGVVEYVQLLQAQLATAKEEINELIAGIDKVNNEGVRLRRENDRLKEFARHVIRQECWSLFEPDGADMQEVAEKLGLIVPWTATKEDVDDESDYEVGDTIFKFSEILKD